MRICPKCRAFYADPQLAFCLVDGTPLVGIRPDSEKWHEGTRALEEKATRLTKHMRKLRWRRLALGGLTTLVMTVVVVTSLTVETTPPSQLVSPTPSPNSSPSATLSSSPSPSSSISPTPTPIPVYTISGTVTSTGQPLSGVDIKLTGAKTDTTKTDSSGRYAFSGLQAGGNYTVTATRTQVNFAPASHSLNSLGKDESADFSAEVFKISGRATRNNQPLGGVKVSLEGSKSVSQTTDGNGYYAFGDLRAGGSYKVSPRGQMGFSPLSRNLDNLRRDESADFTVETPVFKISGRVTSPSQPLAGVKISLAGSKLTSTTTDGNGYYAFSELREGGSYTVTPKAQMKLNPPSRSFDNLRRDEPADFVGREQFELYKISGRVTDARGPLVGITIRLDGTKTDSTATNASGNYTFSNLPAGGNYNITTRAEMKFKPANHSFDNLRHDESADFLGQNDPPPPPPPNPCSEADQNRALNTLRSFEPRWRQQIEGERARIIKENVPGDIQAAHAEASLGEIDFQYAFPKPCKAAVVTARYVWQIVSPLASGRKSVSRQRIIGCGKFLGGWVCH